MIEQFVNLIIRPPRAEYNPDQYLWESEFTLAGRKYKRQDLELANGRRHTLQCSHYVPVAFPENTALPCVIYCHGNSGCRADANEAAVVLLPSNITVFTLDFSGSGLSGGDYVSLGWHEKDDLKIVVTYLRSNKHISCIGLWGRSMGAVTSLLYGAEDPSIAGMVLDSSFSSLYDLMMELVDVYKIRLPKFTVKMAVQYMRRIIQKKAKFDILDLNAVQLAHKTFIPALFGHAAGDLFIRSRHSDLICDSYAGDKNIIKFAGDHNSPRPKFFYDSVSFFFYNVLHPPQIASSKSSESEKYYDLRELKVDAGVVHMDEKLLYEIIAGIRGIGAGAASSSSALPSISNGPSVKSMEDLLSERVSYLNSGNELDFLFDPNDEEAAGNGEESNEQLSVNNDECCSDSSSNQESWGRCSSLGVSEDSSAADCTQASGKKPQMAFKALATPLRRIHRKSLFPTTKEKDKALSTPKKPKRDKLDKWESLRRRVRGYIASRVKHRRNQSS